MKVGFIGLGTMGGGMALNLQKAGFELVVNDIRKASAERHIAKGALWVDTARQVGERRRALRGCALNFEPHAQLRQRVPGAIGLIRTGDTIQYANMVLVSGREG